MKPDVSVHGGAATPRALYDLQSGDGSGPPAAAIVARDAFVIHSIQEFARGRPTPRIAELSAGDGRLAKAIVAGLPQSTVCCADISPAKLAVVKASLRVLPPGEAGRIELLECDFNTQLGCLDTAGYDCVIALDILEHVFDVFAFVDHCRRMLKPSGRLYLRVPNIAFARHRLRLAAGELPVTASWFGRAGDFSPWRERWGWDGGHLHLFTVPILRRLLETSGFRIEACRDPGARWAAMRDLWPNLLYSNPLFVASRS